MKREVAAKAGNFRGVCPLNGRKNSLNRLRFLHCPEFVCLVSDAKSVFVRENAKHPTPCSRKMPHSNSSDGRKRYIYYIYACETLYIVACACIYNKCSDLRRRTSFDGAFPLNTVSGVLRIPLQKRTLWSGL